MLLDGVTQPTGDPVDRYGCSDGFLPMLLIENSQQQRQTGAAVESFRNEMVRLNDASRLLEVGAASQITPSHVKEIADARDD